MARTRSYSDEELTRAIEQSRSWRGVLRLWEDARFRVTNLPAARLMGVPAAWGGGDMRDRVIMSGELDLADVPALLTTLDARIDNGVRRLHVDLESVTFVDAAVLGALVCASIRMTEAGGTLVVSCRSSEPLRLFELAGLEHLLVLPAAHS